MERSCLNLLSSSLCLTLLAAAAPGDALAVTITRDTLVQPAANCQGALPNYEGHIRKRPLAVQNEGDASAFVTCGFQDIDNMGSGTESVSAFFINNSSVAVTVDCTFVNGIFNPNVFPVVYLPKSLVIEPGIQPVKIEWTAADDNGGSNFAAPSLSCLLPAETGLSVINHVFPEEIGG